eukprot:763746-Hanusia_phi.AAC.1
MGSEQIAQALLRKHSWQIHHRRDIVPCTPLTWHAHGSTYRPSKFINLELHFRFVLVNFTQPRKVRDYITQPRKAHNVKQITKANPPQNRTRGR